jgi:hypothetical protein
MVFLNRSRQLERYLFDNHRQAPTRPQLLFPRYPPTTILNARFPSGRRAINRVTC